MRNILNLIKYTVAKKFGYKTTVLMNCPTRGLVATVHYSLTYAGALEWAACYGLEDKVVIREIWCGRQAMIPVGVR